jgi:hypothetical protein
MQTESIAGVKESFCISRKDILQSTLPLLVKGLARLLLKQKLMHL